MWFSMTPGRNGNEVCGKGTFAHSRQGAQHGQTLLDDGRAGEMFRYDSDSQLMLAFRNEV